VQFPRRFLDGQAAGNQLADISLRTIADDNNNERRRRHFVTTVFAVRTVVSVFFSYIVRAWAKRVGA